MRYSDLVFTVYTIPRDTCSQGFHTHTHTKEHTSSSESFSNIRDVTFTVYQYLSYTDFQPSLKSSDFKTWYHFRFLSIFASLLTLNTSLKMSNLKIHSTFKVWILSVQKLAHKTQREKQNCLRVVSTLDGRKSSLCGSVPVSHWCGNPEVIEHCPHPSPQPQTPNRSTGALPKTINVLTFTVTNR